MTRRAAQRDLGNLLCLTNFPANTGFAWDFIERIYGGVADRLSRRGVVTWVVYPEISEPPRVLRGSVARSIEGPTRFDSVWSIFKLVRLIRRRTIRTMYLADRPVWHPAYAAFRWAGVRRIVVHDHTSGDRTPPRGLKRILKALARRWGGASADHVLAVSDYVARRKIEVDLVDPGRVTRVWNGVDTSRARDRRDARKSLDQIVQGVSEGPVVMCVGRAHGVKGLQFLFRAFDVAVSDYRVSGERPSLLYVGDGPYIEQLRTLKARLRAGRRIHLVGYVPDAYKLWAAADVAVFPSVWGEAFGLGALEPMSVRVPIIATSVGGLPEVVEDGVSGLVVPPEDIGAISRALVWLLESPEERLRLGIGGKERVQRNFVFAERVDEIAELVLPSVGEKR